nr:MAG TPA: transmembrane protein [Caudoviricetes sp.]
MTRKQYRINKEIEFAKNYWLAYLKFVSIISVAVYVMLIIWIGAANQHYQKVEQIRTGQYIGDR